MTEESYLLFLQATLQSMNWPTTSNPVFHTNSVIISAAPDADALAKFIMPLCVILPGAQVADTEQPNLYSEEIELTIATSVPGDVIGQNTLMGANRVASTSKGAGLVQICEAVLDTVSMLNALDGMTIKHTFTSGIGVGVLNETSWINYRKLKFTIYINSVGSRVI